MKKISRRSFLKASFATASVAAMAGCRAASSVSQSASTADSSSAAPSDDANVSEMGYEIPAENVTIKFANHMVAEEGTKPFWEKFKADFEKKYPTVTIEYVTAPYGEMVNTVINMAGGGDIVDIMLGEADWVSTMYDAGLTQDVNAFMGEEYVADFLPGVLGALTVDGEVSGLPLYMTPFILYYNADLFEQASLDPATPPTTYDEMLEMAEKLAALKTADGQKVYPFGQTTASVPISGTSLAGMVYNFGGELISEDKMYACDNQGFADTFAMVQQLGEMKYNPDNAKLKDLRNLFALGQVAMYYDQSWGFSGVKSINPEAENFTRSAAPLKGGAGNGESTVSAHSVFLIATEELKKQAVALLVSEMICEETLGEFMTTTNLAYPAKHSMAGMAAIAESPVLSGAMDCLDSAKSVPAIAGISDFYLELCTLAQAVTVGGTSYDDGYATFEKAAKSIIAG